MDVDLPSLFGLHVTWCAQLCTHWLRPRNPPSRIWKALFVSNLRHLYVTYNQGWAKFVLIALERYSVELKRLTFNFR
jgi:hypothetical protein